jgi:D-alanyl-D-alanine carboxypeptidase
VTVSGQLGDGCNSQTYLSLLDHPTYTAGAVRAIWNELGGSIQGGDRIENVPKSARLLARAFSPDLVEVIRDINKYSNNTMAQQLFLSLGAQFRTDADGDDARAAQRVVPMAGEERHYRAAPGDGKRLWPVACRTGQYPEMAACCKPPGRALTLPSS